MEVYFYSNFTKRKNSTLRPTGGVSYNCLMKENCSLSRPVFLVDGINLSYNYCMFNGRYYFVTDITVNLNNIYEVACEIDVLATYKGNIANYSGYIERASDQYDPYIYDRCIVSKREIISPKMASTSLTIFDTTGSYIFPCMNKYGVEIFCTQNLDDFGMLFMPGTYGLSDFTDWLKSGLATLTDLSEKLGKVIWVPFTPSQMNATRISAGTAVSVGTVSFTLDHDMYKIDTLKIIEVLGAFRIQKPTPYYNDFRDTSADWSQYTLFLPGVGTISLDPVIVGHPDVDILPYIYFEPVNGDVTYRLDAVRDYGTTEQTISLLGVYKGNVSAVIPWGDSQFAVKEIGSNLMGGLAGIVGGIASGNYAGAVVSGVAGTVGATIQAFTGANGSCLLGYGGGVTTGKRFSRFIMSQIPLASSDIPNSENGRPLCQIGTIGNHSGYIKMSNADVAISGFAGEKELVNSYLNSGFYYD